MIFEVKIRVVILVTPKQEVEQKTEWFCGVKFIRSNFKVEVRKQCLNKNSLSRSSVVFCSQEAISLWFLLFSIFWIDFFSKWVSQFIHSSF